MTGKKIFLLSLIFLTLLVLPLSFAESLDNETLTLDGNQSAISVDTEDDVLKASNDYYFNASVENDDGDGSIDHPYKYITSQRIKANCNIYLADGEYNLNYPKTIERVNIIGSNTTNTILKYDGVAFTVNDYLTLTNITLVDISIKNYATLNATNTVFSYGLGTDPYGGYYGEKYGGAIYTEYKEGYNPKVTIVNSTFENNMAAYGGAIYMKSGSLDIADSQFINNIAFNYGGAIACENTANITISRSKFIRNYALSDAGGSIYIRTCNGFKADHLEFINSSAAFGGAITTLNCEVTLSYVNFYNSTALWDGGAVYHMYGKFSATNSNFINGTARNGAALYIDNSTELFLRANNFYNNNASLRAGAIYSVFNILTARMEITNKFANNTALYDSDIYHSTAFDFSIGNGNYTMYKFNDTEITVIPSRYSLLDDNYLTPVKDQKNGGNCWAFTALAVLESCIKKATGVEFDFSEENMKNIMAVYSDYGWHIDVNQGGYDGMTYGYLTSWLGPVLDSDDLYCALSALSPVLNSICHVQNILMLKRDNFTDNDAIKRAILKYGAVGTAMYYDDYYLNGTSYYTWISSGTNHAVTIVGWDDNYSRYNFKFGGTIEGDGAWIVRNSWDSDWGDEGYFYVSYYDTTLAKVGRDRSAYTIILNDTIQFDKNYQYDIPGVTGFIYGDRANIFYKNVFTSTANEVIAGVSTYFELMTNWTVSVYVNDVLKANKSGTSNPGYWTINLDEAIQLYMGDVFEIVFNISNSDRPSVPVCTQTSIVKNIFAPGISYISGNGINWIDLYDYKKDYDMNIISQVACIKAFTVLDDVNTTTYLDVVYDGSNPVNITVTVLDQYGNPVSGKVTLTLNGAEQTLNLIKGKATLIHNFDEGLNNISVMFNQKGYVSSSNSTSIEIHKKQVVLYLNITRSSNNVLIYVSASQNINETVMLFVNNDKHTLKLKNGEVSCRLSNLENGNYSVSAFLISDVWKADDVYGSFEVNVKNALIISYDMTTTDFSNADYVIYLKDESGNPISKRNITFTLNNQILSNITDSDGKTSIKINLASGNYNITSFFGGDDDYFAARNTSAIKVKTSVVIDLQYSRYQNNVIINITLSKEINDNITVSINGNNRSASLIRGKAIVNLTGMPNDNYTISAWLDEDEYEFNQNEINFTLNVKNTQIISSDLTVSDEAAFNFTVTLADENGNVLAGETIKINGRDETTDENGTASITLSLTRGDYVIVTQFSGDNDYFASDASNTIYVRTNVDASITIQKSLYDANVTIEFTKPLNETVWVSINDGGNEYNLSSGKLLIQLKNLTNGLYNVSVYLMAYGYNFTKATADFTIDVVKTKIIAGDFTTVDFSCAEYAVILVDENNNPLSGKQVKFVINQKTYYDITASDGQASVLINLTTGKYQILVSYSNITDKYDSFETVKEINVKLNLSGSILVERTFNSVVLDFSFTKPINDTVYVLINAETRDVNVIDGEGYLALNNLSNGNYDVTFKESDKYEFNNLSTSFIIDVKRTQIIANDVSVYYHAESVFEIKLVDENGQALKNKTLMVYVDGNAPFVLNTTDSGIVSISTSEMGIGSHDVEILFLGDNDYYLSQGSAKISEVSSISLPQNRYTLNSAYKATLYGKNGKLVGKSVEVILNGVKYTSTTDKNGQISLNINLKVGSYTVRITNPETGEVKTQKINVVARLTGNKNIVMYYGAGKTYSVKVFDDSGKVVGAGVAVTFKVNGKSFTVKTKKNGIASYKITLMPKTYTIKATYKGYTVSNKIKVKTTLITKNKVAKKAKKIKYTAKLLNKKGKALKGKKITFKIKGKKYVSKTNKKGIATIKIKNLKVGKYKIVATYAKLKSTSKITIKK